MNFLRKLSRAAKFAMWFLKHDIHSHNHNGVRKLEDTDKETYYRCIRCNEGVKVSSNMTLNWVSH
jgi:hypothetical protein